MTVETAASPAPAAHVAAAVDEALARHAGEPGALLPVLHAVQDRLRHVPREAVPRIAQALNLSRAEVHGVLGFYHHFRSTPPGRRVLQVCQAEACRAMGADALMARARALQAEAGDAALTLEPVYCLGLCACAPAAQLDEAVHARLTPAALEALLAEPAR